MSATRTEAEVGKPDGSWRTRILAVPLLALASLVCFGANVVMSNAHTHRESAACRYMPLPWTDFAVAYGALIAAVLALLLHFGLFRSARRKGWNPTGTWGGGVSVACAVAAGLLVLTGVAAVVMTHSQASHIQSDMGTPMCEGAGPLSWGP